MTLDYFLLRRHGVSKLWPAYQMWPTRPFRHTHGDLSVYGKMIVKNNGPIRIPFLDLECVLGPQAAV